jgi:hypothetical protein
MWYTVALFVHILGAIGLFVAVSLIVVALVRMRRASTLEQVREWASVANVAGKSMIFISLVILAPALSMVILAWGFMTPWVMASLITFVVLSIMGAAMNGRRLEQVVVMTQKASPGPIPADLRAQLLAPQLWLPEGVRLMLLLGILCLMTIKPDMLFSILILVGMLILGLILGTLAQRFPVRLSEKQQLV